MSGLSASGRDCSMRSQYDSRTMRCRHCTNTMPTPHPPSYVRQRATPLATGLVRVGSQAHGTTATPRGASEDARMQCGPTPVDASRHLHRHRRRSSRNDTLRPALAGRRSAWGGL
eukprot:74694-Pyramimonas_sp.AAC.2